MFTLSASYSNTMYEDPAVNRKDLDYIYSLDYRYNLTRNAALLYNLSSLQRDSSIDIQDYDDFRFMINLEYRSL